MEVRGSEPIGPAPPGRVEPGGERQPEPRERRRRRRSRPPATAKAPDVTGWIDEDPADGTEGFSALL